MFSVNINNREKIKRGEKTPMHPSTGGNYY